MESPSPLGTASDKLPRLELPTTERSFVGAIRLANWIKRHHWYPSAEGTVNVSEGNVWPGFKNAVERHRGKKIQLHLRDDLTITSISLQANDCYEILLPNSFNTCHRRFALCKELCHILTDDNTVRAIDPFEQLTSALLTVKRVRDFQGPGEINPLFTSSPLSSEDFCLLLALEILIPIKDRDNLVSQVTVKGVTAYDVAVRLRIPESLVNFFVHSGYHLAFKRAHGSELR